jgi:outer membrane lipoprotein
MKRSLFLLAVLLMTGCSTTPTVFNTPIEGAPDIANVMQDQEERYAGQRVRWGGEIIAVRNQPEETWIEVLQRPLMSSGRPQDKPSEGRFFIKLAGFVEPVDYSEGKSITAVGELSGFIAQKVGEFDYRYPVVSVEKAHHMLWQELKDRSAWQVRPSLYWDWPWHYSPFHRGVGARVILIKDGENQ